MLLGALLALVSACGTAPSRVIVGTVCPSLPSYTQGEQNLAADELDALPDTSFIKNVLIVDYGRMRDGVRACIAANDAH
jgi:hypothetical protein